METIEGRATRVSCTIAVSGSRRYASAAATHVMLFQLGARMVRIRSAEPVRIDEGDEVRVVGTAHRGALDALAYENLSTSTQGGRGWLAALVFGLILAVSGLGMVSASFRAAEWSPLALAALGAALVPPGACLAYRGTRVLAALTQLRRPVS